jgi:hypothetical protein
MIDTVSRVPPLAALLAAGAVSCGDNLPGAVAVDAAIDAAADAAQPTGHCGVELCLSIDSVQSAAGIGRGQGVEWRDGLLYLYGDRDTGVIREYEIEGGQILFTGREMVLTEAGLDRISHPTGLTRGADGVAFVGDTVSGRGRIFAIDWARLVASGTLDGAVRREVADGAAVNGSRPEQVVALGRRLIASADYGDRENALRLYDPEALVGAADTVEPGVLVAELAVGPFVQSLAYHQASDLLVLVQNTSRARGWRLTFLELAASIAAGEARVRDVVELPYTSELEGFHWAGGDRVVLVTDEAADNVFVARLRPRADRRLPD